jgi:predicted ATP-grasp superfamily ATP-dependent carboligase
MAYLEAIGEEVQPHLDYESGVRWIWLLRDLRVLKAAFLAGDRDYRKWIASYLGEKNWVYCAKDDPKPFIETLSSLLSSKVPRLR